MVVLWKISVRCSDSRSNSPDMEYSLNSKTLKTQTYPWPSRKMMQGVAQCCQALRPSKCSACCHRAALLSAFSTEPGEESSTI
eukprot:1798863-Amphidinium_carterae.1